MGNIVRQSNIGINLAQLQDIPYMFYGDVAQLSYGLKSSSFINYVENRTPINIYNINKNRIVEIGILVFLQCELKPSKRFAMFLVVGIVLSKIVNNLLIDIIIARAF